MGITSFQASSGANRALSNLGSTSINTALLPDTHNSYDLGSSAVRWQDAYIGNQLVVGVGSIPHSVDSQIVITRAVNDSIAGNAHAFSDSSDVTRGGHIGYNSFDARINILGSEDYDHYAGFQFGPVIATSGTVDKLYGYFHTGAINNGVIVNSYGFYIGNMLGTGNITNQYGVYVAAMSKGDNSNYAIYTAGTTRSHFEGTVECDQTITFTAASSIGTKSLGHHSSNYMYLTGGSAGLKLTDDGLKGITIEDGGSAHPSTHNSFDFGSDAARWKDVYIGGQVSIGTGSPATSAALDINSGTGALIVPRMTTTERLALTAINGMIVYDTTLNAFQAYENGSWRAM